MLSIIICSRTGVLPESIKRNVNQTVGCDYELVVVDNSKNEHSIFSAYNLGVTLSKYPYLCFVHDDVEFVTNNWGNNIIDHLNTPNVGIIGVAGGRAMLRVPFGWASFAPMKNIIQSHIVDNVCVDKKYLHPAFPENTKEKCLVLDGVFLCARKDIFKEISFDTQLGGFHCYDMDICLQAGKQKFQNYVIFDVDIKHFSRGNFNSSYIYAILRLHEKWVDYLPFFDHEYDQDFIKNALYRAEKNAFIRFKKLLIRSRMSFDEIKPIVIHFAHIIGKRNDKLMLAFIHFELSLLRFESTIRKKMIKKQHK